MKKRFLSAALAALMLLSAFFYGCGPKRGAGNETGGGTDVTDDGFKAEVPSDFEGYVLRADASGKYDISDNLFGIFLEDINFAVDGGLYAELVCNRSFEYGSLTSDGAMYTWSKVGGAAVSVVDGSKNGSSLNENNPHYAKVRGSAGDGIANSGFNNSTAIEKDGEYVFSVFARAVNGYSGALKVALTRGTKTLAEGETEKLTDEWRKYTLTLKADADSPSATRVTVTLEGTGAVDLDMVSLFPKDTFKGRENGIRRDLGEMLEALEPKFFRFPGGCIIEGSTLAKAYSWKDSIGDGMEFEINGETTVGDVATRPLGESIWSWNWQPYYMSYGLGFYEYFLLCEDLDCAPVPVVNCGMSCQGQPGPNGVETPSINGDVFKQYIQDALDLVEFCRGGEDTKWGAVRAAMGHPEPFELEYIGIGNEQWGDEYNRRYAKFREAFNEAKEKDPALYGDIKLIMANGPLATSQDGWNIVKSKGNDIAELLDEHYYCDPSWFLANTDRYNSYDREGPTVFVGEYAAKSNTSAAAIAEAAYMTSLERNGDIVELAAYAPLFASEGRTQWEPDLIWFTGSEVWGSVNYYVQKIFSKNQPDAVIPTETDLSHASGGALTGMVGVGTWKTMALFDDFEVTDNKTGDVLYSNDFSSEDLSGTKSPGGQFVVRQGGLAQTSTGNPANDITGDVIYLTDIKSSSYTVTFKAQKRSGSEGFIIPFAVDDEKNFYHWNIGGWNNTVSCLEHTTDNVKSGIIDSTNKPFTVEDNREYKIKLVIDGASVKGYIDDELMIDYTASDALGIYSVIGEDEDDIIVKIVNTGTSDISLFVDLSSATRYSGDAELEYIDFISPETVNNRRKASVEIKTDTIKGVDHGTFEFSAEGYSMVVIRVPKK